MPFNSEALKVMSDDLLYEALLELDYPSFFPDKSEERSTFESEEEKAAYQKTQKDIRDSDLNNARKHHEQIMKKELKLSPFTQFKLPFIAYYKSFSKNSVDGIPKQLAKKSLALLGLFAMTLTRPITYLVEYSMYAGVNSVGYFFIGFATSLMAVLNVPMYLWDAANSLTNLWNSYFNKECSVPVSEQTQESHSTMQRLMPAEGVIQQNDKEPSPIASRSPVDERDTEESLPEYSG